MSCYWAKMVNTKSVLGHNPLCAGFNPIYVSRLRSMRPLNRKLASSWNKHRVRRVGMWALKNEAYVYEEKESWHKSWNDGVDQDDMDRGQDIWLPENEVNEPFLRDGSGEVGVILELEGVIVEYSPELENEAWIRLSGEEGIMPPPAFVLKRIQGMKNEQAISEVLCWSRNPVEVRRMARRKEEIYQDLEGGSYRLRSGSPEFVNILMTYEIPMALVSARPRETMETVIGTIGFEGYFPVIVTAEDVERGRPDPEMFLYAAQFLGSIPERCIVFGNSNETVQAAHDALMKCVAVASKHPRYELGAADVVVMSLDELSVIDLKNLASTKMPEVQPSDL